MVRAEREVEDDAVRVVADGTEKTNDGRELPEPRL